MSRPRLQRLNNGTEDSISSQQMSDPQAYRLGGENPGRAKPCSRHASGDSGPISRIMSSSRGAVSNFGHSLPRFGSLSSAAGPAKRRSMHSIPGSSHSLTSPLNQANSPTGDERDVSALRTFPPVATPTSLMSSQTLVVDPSSRNRSTESAFERLDKPLDEGEKPPVPGRQRPPMSRSEEPPFAEPPIAAFKPSFSLYMAFATMAVFTLMVALDSTALSVALPVGVWQFSTTIDIDRFTGDCRKTSWHSLGSLLGSNFLSTHIYCLSANYRGPFG